MEIILHLTDLHFGSEGENLSSQAQRKVCLDSLLKELAKLDSDWNPTVICITGDLVWRGADSDYEKAKQWLDQLLSICGLTYEQLIICVGNHEVNRKLAEKLPRPSNAEEADNSLAPPLTDFLQQPFLSFTRFCAANGIPVLNFGDAKSYLIGVREHHNIKFLALNSCWFSKDNQDKGKLWMGFPHLRYLEANDQLSLIQLGSASPVTIALMHHPVSCLHEEEQHAFQARPNTWDYLARRCDVLLSGHTHGESRRADKIAEGAHHFTGGATYADATYLNSFRLLKIDHENIVYKTFDFDPRSADTTWKPSNAVSLPIRQQTQATQESPQTVPATATDKLREALRADAQRQRDRKSRLLRPTGPLPSSVPQQVSLRVSKQLDRFDPMGRMLREDKSEHVMPLYEAVREARRTLLLGDLGTGKSTLAAQLVIETLERSVTAVAVLLPVKSLKLPERLLLQDLLQALDAYISGEIMPGATPAKLLDLLQSQIEVLLVLDGLDELSRDCAGRLLCVAATLTEHWPTIQVVATARPVEMRGVSFADWQIIHTTSLQEAGKRQFLLEELIADGVSPELAEDKAQALLRVLREMPALNSLAVTPLIIRMIYPRLDAASSQASLSLGDLLYELLTERLNGWQQRDDKPVNFADFEAVLPTAEAKAEFLSVLAQKPVVGISITPDAARASLMDAAAKFEKVDPHALSDQALTCFKWLGLIELSDVLEFPLQPLAEMAAAIGLIKQWREEGKNTCLPSNDEWRVVSFAAAVARRRLWLDELRLPLQEYIKQLLQDNNNVPAACYIVAETNDASYAKHLIQAFSRLGYHPLVPFGDEERIASTRNIAKALWLAGTEGFDWLFGQYLDPKHTIPHAGSGIIQGVFYQWAILAHGHLDAAQKQRLSTMVMPYLATDEANFYGVLGVLSMLVPEAFDLEDRFWHQLSELDSPTFSDGIFSKMRLYFSDLNIRPLLEKMLLHRAPGSPAAALHWLELNPDSEPPIEIIRAAFRYASKTVTGNAVITLSTQCRQRIGQERWLRFARWLLSDGDNSVACGAALALHEAGENRLSLLGDVFMSAMHDGGYIAAAEKIMAELIHDENDKGINWLVNRMASPSDSRLGGHSGWWRLLLANITKLEAGPDKLAGCLQALGQFILPRYPEVREAFSRLLNGPNGSAYRQALRNHLYDLDSTIRHNAAYVLVTTDPCTEGEALFIAVRSRAVGWHHDQHEWESFCLTLDFSPVVLGFLQSRMNLLEPQSRAFARVLLAKGKLIKPDFQVEWLDTLFDIGNWHLLRDPICQDMLGSKEALAFLLQQLAQPNSKFARTAAEQLLRSHRAVLTTQVEAQCILLESRSTHWPKSFTEQMIRLADDAEFRRTLTEAYGIMRNQGCNPLPLGLVAQAIQSDIPWKDALWSMFVADPGGDQAEVFGTALLQYGSIKQEHRQTIGQAAIHCMDDPRTKATRWIENYHWLALIADEFIGLEVGTIREVLEHANGQPIHCAAAAALLARLGEVPDGVHFGHGVRKRPDLSAIASYENVEVVLFQQLLDYARDAEKLHTEILNAIERYLFFPQADEVALEKLTAQGKPGILISTALRFCYGTDPKPLETLPLLSEWGRLWHNLGQNRQLERLLQIWMSSRSIVLRDNRYAVEQYLEALDKEILIGNHWILPLATEILNIRKSLLPSQINTVFSEYVKHHTFLHERLFEQFVTWLSGDLDSATRDAILEAVQAPLVVLGESDRSVNGDNNCALLLFPCVYWALGGEQTQTARVVFLQGMRSVLNKELTPTRDASSFSMSTVLAKLEPLLKKVPHTAIASSIETGLTSPDPAARAFCYIIESLAEAYNPSSRRN